MQSQKPTGQAKQQTQPISTVPSSMNVTTNEPQNMPLKFEITNAEEESTMKDFREQEVI
jgi:hypothetical protein